MPYAKNERRRLRREARIELAKPARRGVARVHERLLARFGRALVDDVEVLARHEDLAAHFDEPRQLASVEAQRDGTHGAQVRRHVLARGAVAAGGALHEEAVFVREGDGEAVELELRGVFDRFGFQPFAHAAIEGSHVLLVECVGEREHRHAVLDGGEAIARRGAHALRRRIRRAQLRVLLLQLRELLEEAIVVGVADLGRRLVVVEAVVPLDRAAQLVGARGQVLRAHVRRSAARRMYRPTTK
jgi:hypothetical protein